MTDKPKPSASSKPAAKPAGSAGASTKGQAGSTNKSKPDSNDDNEFAFLAPPVELDEMGRLAHYRVLKVLGRGGMGTVFMAEDTRLHRHVALKVMLPSIARKAIARDRFMREARATAKIEHDHIVTIYEVNEDNGVPYLAMQVLKGMTLDDWLKAGKSLNVPQIMRIGKEIAKGLAAAHAHDLMHRDIKPSNIWLDASNKGRVKILDFGLVRQTNDDTQLTQEGLIIGTPAYMSPEQARGMSVDARSDLFSMGCVLYRLCAGKLPFAGKDAIAMLLAITTEEPAALREMNHEMPRKFLELVHQLLAKRPEDRPTSAKAVVHAIQDIERDWVGNAKTIGIAPGRSGRSHTPPPDQTVAEAGHDALEESAITEFELEASGSAKPPLPSRNKSWLVGCIGGALIAAVSVICCLGVLFSSNQGTLTVVPLDEEAKAFLQTNGLTVADHNRKATVVKSGEHLLPSGGYQVETDGLPMGIRIDPQHFNVTRGENRELKVGLRPLRPSIVQVTSDQAKKIQLEWAAYLRSQITETNSIGAKLVLIPPGILDMGSTKEQIRPDPFGKKTEKKTLPNSYWAQVLLEAPQHRVRITKPYFLGATEITFEHFQQFVSDTKYQTDPEKAKGGTGVENGSLVARKPEFHWRNPGYKPAPNHPVNNITWSDADAFCKWLGKKEGKLYRLPTEAEWEYACRAGAMTLWSFGDDAKKDAGGDYMWFHLPGFLSNPDTPKLVGSKRQNNFELHDMHGNVAEMCSDFFAVYSPKEVEDPKGPVTNFTNGRVVRGGSFLDVHQMTRSAYRHGVEPTLGYVNIGFRVVCEIPMPSE